MTDEHRQDEADSAAWQALEDWLGQDDEGRLILAKLRSDPTEGKQDLVNRLQRSDVPAGVFNRISDTTIDKLVNIARADQVTILASWIDRYWKAPAVGAVASFLLAFAVGMAPIAAYNSVSPESPLPLFQGALIAFFMFQRVPLNVHLSGDAFGLPMLGGSGRIVLTLAGGWLLTACALCLGGYVAARLQGGSERNRILAGGRVAVPLAILAGAASFISIGTRNAALGTHVGWGISPSHFGAIFFPMLWGLVFGLMGASIQVYGRTWFRKALALLERRFPGWSSPVQGTLMGIAIGWAVLLVFLIVAVAIATINGDTSLAEQSSKASGPESVITFLLLALLAVPHVLALGFLAAMGVSMNWTAEISSSPTDSVNKAISIFRGLPELPVPKYFLLLLLVAALAACASGYLAARRAEPEERAALRAGLRVALPFTLACWFLAFLGRGTYSLEGSMLFLGRNTIAGGLGPSTLEVVFLPVIWGLLGGCIGALLYVRQAGLVGQQA